jgi:2-polyprenyl-3-methyl-5-hydroxy-6-metoxy-1,4-benzoquinol methylase
MKIKKCRNCNSKKLQKLFSLGNLYFTGKFKKKNNVNKKGIIELIMCKNCKLVQLAHSFNLNYLYGPDYGYRTGINKTMTTHVKSVVKNLTKKTNLKNNESVLDIASNDGTLLNSYKNKKIKTFGIDPLIYKYPNNYKKINHKVSDFFSKEKVRNVTTNKFKIITALSVFYDLENPNKFLNDVKNILSKDGVFLIEFADLASILKYKMFDTLCHEHLEYYSSSVILEMCEANNLRLFDMKLNDVNGGSTQYFICHKTAKYKDNKKNLTKIFHREKKLKLEEKKTYKTFISEINLIKEKIKKMIKNAKNDNKSIHCYGASTKGNVLLQYFNINNKDIDCVAERNPKKYNLYTPGTNIKIVSEKKSRKLKPDYYLVLPWHFKKEILQREKKTISNGTKLIFPLPYPKIFE